MLSIKSGKCHFIQTIKDTKLFPRLRSEKGANGNCRLKIEDLWNCEPIIAVE